jgi:hypothetical protein
MGMLAGALTSAILATTLDHLFLSTLIGRRKISVRKGKAGPSRNFTSILWVLGASLTTRPRALN